MAGTTNRVLASGAYPPPYLSQFPPQWAWRTRLFLPRDCSAQPHGHEDADLDRFGVDFDIAYFYGETTRTTTNEVFSKFPLGPIVMTSRSWSLCRSPNGEKIFEDAQKDLRRRNEIRHRRPPLNRTSSVYGMRWQGTTSGVGTRDSNSLLGRGCTWFHRHSGSLFHLRFLRLVREIQARRWRTASRSSSDPPTTPSVYSSESWTERCGQILLLRNGCISHGISERTLKRWRRKGQTHKAAPQDLAW